MQCFNGDFKVLKIIVPSHQDVFVRKSVAAAVLAGTLLSTEHYFILTTDWPSTDINTSEMRKIGLFIGPCQYSPITTISLT